MKKTVIAIFAILLLASFSIFASAASLDKNNWAVVATPGQTLTNTFTFTTGVNDSQNLTITTTGAISNWVTNTPATLNIGQSSTASFTSTLAIPAGANNQTYTGNINYAGTTSGTVTINIFMQLPADNPTGCSLVPLPSSFTKNLQAESLNVKQQIILLTGCSQPVIIRSIDIVGDVVTGTDGKERPVRLDEINLGQMQPNTQISLPLTLDTTGVSTGVYNAVLRIDATTQNSTRISATVPMTIVVTQGNTPLGNVSQLSVPDYQIPQTVNSGSDLTITVASLNPNLQPSVQPNKYLIGKPVSLTGNTWTWSGTVNKSEGTIDVEIATLFKGNPIGALVVRTVKVLLPGYTAPVGNLTVSFIPEIQGTYGDVTSSMLCRDSASQNIVDCKIYVNNVESADKKIGAKQGVTYLISATSTGYQTYNAEIKRPLQNLQVSLSNSQPEYNTTVNVMTNTASPNDTILLLDGTTTISGSFVASLPAGPHFIKASGLGQDITVNFTITPKLQILTPVPESIAKNEPVAIQLNKPANWEVDYKSDNKTEIPWEVLAKQETPVITFLPKEAGLYAVFLRGQPLATYAIKPGLSKTWAYVLGALGIAAAAFFLFKIFKGGGGRSGMGVGSSSYDDFGGQVEFQGNENF